MDYNDFYQDERRREQGQLTESLPSYTAKTFLWMFLGLLTTFGVAVGGYVSGIIIYAFLSIPAFHMIVLVAELAVVLGRDAKNVAEADAFDYVFGYTIVNDVSARNLQTGHKQWYFGKGLDGFTPMGPCLVTRDEFPQPPALAIRTYVNGELRQDAVTDQLLFSIPHILHELSQGMTLQAGTIIATGTPAGVGMGFDPPKFLQSGDVVRCEIQGIGILENPVL